MEPCKEPPPWFAALKPWYDSLGRRVAKSLCWKQCSVCSATRASSWSLRRDGAISNTSARFLLVHRELGRRGNTRPCLSSVRWAESLRDEREGNRWKRKSRQAFYIEEFPVRWVSASLPLKRLRERKNEAHWVPAVWAYECMWDRAFARQVAAKMPSK